MRLDRTGSERATRFAATVTQSTIAWRFSMLVGGIVIGIVSSLDDARAAETKGDSEQSGRVIYNLDCFGLAVGCPGDRPFALAEKVLRNQGSKLPHAAEIRSDPKGASPCLLR